MSLYESDAAVEPAKVTRYRRRASQVRFPPKPARPTRLNADPSYEQIIARAAFAARAAGARVSAREAARRA